MRVLLYKISIILLTSLTLSGCGGVGGEDRSQFDGDTPTDPTTPPSTDTPQTQEYQLQVSVSGSADNVQFTWMRQVISQAPGFNGTFSATGEEFEEPVVPESSEITCTVSLTQETQLLYLYQISCDNADSTPSDPNPTNTTITTAGTLSYPVNLLINQQQRTLQEGTLESSEVDTSPEIVGLEGPQTCSLSGSSPAFTLTCEAFTAGYGGINNDERQLYLAYSNRDVAYSGWDEDEMGRIIGGYFWVDSMLWIQTSTNRVYSISFADGSAGQPVLRASDVQAMTSLDERILIMQQANNNQQNFIRYQDGSLSQSTPYSNHTVLPYADNTSPFRTTQRRVSWLVQEAGSAQFKLAGFVNVFTDLKSLPAAINKDSGLPVFNYDDNNLYISFDENQPKYGLTDTNEAEMSLSDLDSFSSATLWRNASGNEFLFHTREDAVAQQFTQTINNETTSAGFNLAQLEQKITDWVAGDGQLLIAGERLNETNGKLTYLRFGENELTESQIKNLLNVSSDLQTKLFTNSSELNATLTSVKTSDAHVLVYTGTDAAGTIWLLAGDTGFKVKDNATITGFNSFSEIVNTTPYQAIIQDTADRIIVVPKQ